ncbi:hypothetical protein, variant [Salpingoeca rosetta]|nr:hypothetical protein, variant [Salpingoeca rosetta]EGD83323.1 hypothetical protein, variant [Salpingoeca rosetta]|eukprot:XP_004994827.1 hypothetical protein, variant [Salpingoeca rosetta]
MPKLKRPKTHDAEHRRKSTGRSERRSLVHMEVAKSLDPTAIYTDISDDLPSEERFMRLVSMCLERSISNVANNNASAFKGFNTHAEAVAETFKTELLQDGEDKAAVEAPVLRPNPKNSQMKRNLRLYENSRTRLSSEEDKWSTATSDAAATVAAATAIAHRLNTLTDATQDTQDAGSKENREKDSEPLKELEAQVKVLEQTARIFRSVDEHMRTFVARQQAGVAQTADEQQANPSRLIRDITKTAPES